MIAETLARRAYADPRRGLKSGRQTEYKALAKCTFQMRDAASNGAQGFPALAKALHENQRLWTLLATDVAQAENGLPNDLRARIFYLAEFTQHHTRKVMRDRVSIKPLLEINVAVLKGLRHGSQAR